jgi:hypothetical protein
MQIMFNFNPDLFYDFSHWGRCHPQTERGLFPVRGPPHPNPNSPKSDPLCGRWPNKVGLFYRILYQPYNLIITAACNGSLVCAKINLSHWFAQSLPQGLLVHAIYHPLQVVKKRLRKCFNLRYPNMYSRCSIILVVVLS